MSHYLPPVSKVSLPSVYPAPHKHPQIPDKLFTFKLKMRLFSILSNVLLNSKYRGSKLKLLDLGTVLGYLDLSTVRTPWSPLIDLRRGNRRLITRKHLLSQTTYICTSLFLQLIPTNPLLSLSAILPLIELVQSSCFPQRISQVCCTWRFVPKAKRELDSFDLQPFIKTTECVSPHARPLGRGFQSLGEGSPSALAIVPLLTARQHFTVNH